jgi:hypothetical protein
MDPFDEDALRGPEIDLKALGCRPSRTPPRHRQGEKFLKGPIPWPWLAAAFPLPGKAMHLALVLWREAGCRRSRTVRLCLSGELPPGLSRQSARRALRRLAGAGLITVHRRPGCGLEVVINDFPSLTNGRIM